MTKSQIEYVLAVEQMGSFSKAADHCYITQSTLSAMVAKFEKQIGIVIFNRKTKPIALTFEGVRIINQLKEIKRDFEILDEVVNQIKGVETGSLSIAAIPTIAPYLFPIILNKIAKKFPEVNFMINELTTQKVIEDIFSGKIDVGIVAIPLDTKDLIEIPLYKESFMLYDKRGITKTTKSAVNIEEIDFTKLLLLEEGHCFSTQVSKICKLNQVKKIGTSITYNSGSIESLKKMVTINKGITLLPYLSTLDLSAKEQKNVRHFEKPTPGRQIGLVYHKNLVKEKLVKEIEKIIIQKIDPINKASRKMNVISPI